MYDDLAAKIRQRAYLIWEHENRPDGKDLEHWLRAEAEIKTDQSDATNQAEHPSPGRRLPVSHRHLHPPQPLPTGQSARPSNAAPIVRLHRTSQGGARWMHGDEGQADEKPKPVI